MQESLEARLSLSFDDAVETVSGELKKEGFGILTRIDLDRAFEEKLGKSFRPYTILGACNPPLAFRAVTARPEVGLYLPCNVTVEAMDGGACRVRLLDPMDIMGQSEFGDDAEMMAVADEARDRLGRVAERLRAVG